MERILTPKGTATHLGISVRTLRRLRKAGAFPPHIQLSARRIGWRAEDIELFLDEGGVHVPN